MSRDNHCPIFPIHLFFCKQMQTVKKACSDTDPRGTTGLLTLPKPGFSGWLLSCHQPSVVICLLSHWFCTRQQYEETETSNWDALTVGGIPLGVRGKGEVKKQEEFIQLKDILCCECIISHNEPVTT